VLQQARLEAGAGRSSQAHCHRKSARLVSMTIHAWPVSMPIAMQTGKHNQSEAQGVRIFKLFWTNALLKTLLACPMPTSHLVVMIADLGHRCVEKRALACQCHG
jgi:hypothetical protein